MKKLFFAVLFAASSVYCQTTVNHLIVSSGFKLESLSGYGYSKTLGSQSDIAGLNPAAMERFSSLSAGLSYQFETDIKPGWIGALPSSRYKRSIPQSAGIILPYKDLRLGFGISQKYNSSVFTDDIATTTVEQPYGTGNFMYLTEESHVLRYAGLLSYGHSSLLKDGDRLSLGIGINYDKIEYNYNWGMKGSDPQSSIKSHGNKMSFSAGLTWSYKSTETAGSLFSLFYESRVEFDKMTTDEIKNISDLSRIGGWFPITEDRAVSKYPGRINLGFDHSFSEKSQITTTLSYIGWSGTDANKNDYVEAAAGYIYSLQKELSVSAGLYYSGLSYKDDYFDLNKRSQALFITAGAVYSFSLADVDLVIADSHLVSGEFRKETIGKLSVGFHL